MVSKVGAEILNLNEANYWEGAVCLFRCIYGTYVLLFYRLYYVRILHVCRTLGTSSLSKPDTPTYVL